MTTMALEISKKTISEIIEITKKEISNDDTFVAITSIVHDSPNETLEKLLDELKLYGVFDLSNPVIVAEAFPKKFTLLSDPDYQKWGWDENMYNEFTASPFLVLIFDKTESFTSIEIDAVQFKNWCVFLFDKHTESEISDFEWLKSVINSSVPFDERSLRPVTLDEMGRIENENNGEYNLRILAILLGLNLRPSSVHAMYVASQQYQLDNDMSQKSKRGHTPETPVFSQLIDKEKISNDKSFASEKTVGWFEFAVHLDPKNFQAWNTLGFIYKDTCNYEKSENCFRQCMRHNSGFVGAYHALSHLLTSQGFLKKALQVIADGLKHHNTSDLHNSKALCLLELGVYDESIIEAKKSLDIITSESSFDRHVPNDFFLFTVMVAVRALMATNRISEIIPIFEPVLTMYPSSSTSVNNFGYFLQKDGQEERAVESWKKAISIEPDNWAALLNLGMHFHDANNFLEASLYFEKSTKTCPMELHNNIKDRDTDSLKKFRDAEMRKTFPEKVSKLGGFSITGDRQEDVKNFVSLLSSCKSYVFWLDAYFSKEGFSWIVESCISPTDITDVRIMTSSKSTVELTGLPFKKAFSRTKKELHANKISFSLKVISRVDHIRNIHGRCVVSENGSWEIPSVNNIQKGSKDKVSPSDREVSEFDAEWNNALDFENDYDEIKKLKHLIKKN